MSKRRSRGKRKTRTGSGEMVKIKICFSNGTPKGSKAHAQMFFQETFISHTFPQEMLFPTNLLFKEYQCGSFLHHHFGILVPLPASTSSSFQPKSFQVRNRGAIDNKKHFILSGSSSLVLLVFFKLASITGHSLDFNVPIIIICGNSITIGH